jgi:RNA polymerase sigma-70 factor, ECF subfamily
VRIGAADRPVTQQRAETLATGNAARDPRDDITHYLSSLRAFAISLTRNVTMADDLVQDTIVKAWTHIDKFQPGTNMQAWLFTILRNTFYSDRRKHKREVPDPDGIHAASLFQNPAHDGRLAFTDFRRAFDQLSPEHREVLVLVGASGFSCEQASEMMGVAVGTVKSRTSRARKRLAELMGLAEGETVLTEGDLATGAAMTRAGMQAA